MLIVLHQVELEKNITAGIVLWGWNENCTGFCTATESIAGCLVAVLTGFTSRFVNVHCVKPGNGSEDSAPSTSILEQDIHYLFWFLKSNKNKIKTG